MTDGSASAGVVREGLAATYEWDMGQRTADLGLWAGLVAEAAEMRGSPVVVIEVGGGTARVPRALALDYPHLPIARWVGMDVDPAMVDSWSRRAPAWASVTTGDAADASTWVAASRLAGCQADLVLIPYATLFLLPHASQPVVLAHAVAALRHGGRLAAEVYPPAWLTSGTERRTTVCTPTEPDPAGRTWVRQTTYQIDGATRTTVAERVYGPADPTADRPTLLAGRACCRVTERIHWRLPAELAPLASEAGLDPVAVRHPSHDPRIPVGYCLLLGRKPGRG